jgi:hypothetical protein
MARPNMAVAASDHEQGSPRIGSPPVSDVDEDEQRNQQTSSHATVHGTDDGVVPAEIETFVRSANDLAFDNELFVKQVSTKVPVEDFDDLLYAGNHTPGQWNAIIGERNVTTYREGG